MIYINKYCTKRVGLIISCLNLNINQRIDRMHDLSVVPDEKTLTEMARAEIGPWHTKILDGSFVGSDGRGISMS